MLSSHSRSGVRILHLCSVRDKRDRTHHNLEMRAEASYFCLGRSELYFVHTCIFNVLDVFDFMRLWASCMRVYPHKLMGVWGGGGRSTSAEKSRAVQRKAKSAMLGGAKHSERVPRLSPMHSERVPRPEPKVQADIYHELHVQILHVFQ